METTKAPCQGTTFHARTTMLGGEIRRCERCAAEYAVGRLNDKTACKDLAKQAAKARRR